MISRARVFRWCLAALIASIGVSQSISLNIQPFVVYCALLIILCAVILAWRHTRTRIGLCIFLFALFGIYCTLLHASADESFQASVANIRQASGIAESESVIRAGRQYILMRTTNGRIIVSFPQAPLITEGNAFTFSCTHSLMTIQEQWMQKRYGTAAFCASRDAPILQEGGNGVRMSLVRIRHAVLAAINGGLPFVHAQLLGGILIGVRQSFPPELKDSFSRIGLSHIVAVSGYNITIIIAMLYAACSALRLKRSQSLFVILCVIAGFTILTGGSAATVRASIMGGLAIAARAAGRGAKMHAAILLTATGMLVQNPSIVFDIGFQLSFLAMIGLIYLSPIIERRCASLPDAAGLKPILIQTLAAIGMTSPLIVWYFGNLSLIAPFANLFILPVVPMAMALGAASTVFSFAIAAGASSVSGNFSPYLWAFAWAPLDYIIRFSSFLSHVPFASVAIRQPFLVTTLVLSAYGFLGALLFRHSTRRAEVCEVS